jgi:Skp family chaperone for outer membrane proteins
MGLTNLGGIKPRGPASFEELSLFAAILQFLATPSDASVRLGTAAGEVRETLDKLWAERERMFVIKQTEIDARERALVERERQMATDEALLHDKYLAFEKSRGAFEEQKAAFAEMLGRLEK